ncbi:metallopeptidase family protein [Metallococcus carri]|nr:metallopeptidase family protein [Metallococcus carri]
MATRGRLFDEAVLDSFERVEGRLEGRPDIELAVEDVPPSDPAPWEDRVALGRAFPAVGGTPARVVIYRRPIETRVTSQDDLADLIETVVAENVAGLLGRNPDDLRGEL